MDRKIILITFCDNKQVAAADCQQDSGTLVNQCQILVTFLKMIANKND